jgi:2,4-dienoyl-CoA reductase-like NADH-dependent reductase (Old Yellow Enzyme family)
MPVIQAHFAEPLLQPFQLRHLTLRNRILSGPQSGYHGHVSSPRHIERSVRFSSHNPHLFASCLGL